MIVQGLHLLLAHNKQWRDVAYHAEYSNRLLPIVAVRKYFYALSYTMEE